MTREDIKNINDIVHKTIHEFFDTCGDNEEVPMTDKDKLLLAVNKAVCNNIKALEQEDKQKQAPEIKVGDEVITKYAEHAVAVRDTYYVGKDREPFTLIWFGTHMASCPVNNLTKTGKHYPQIAEIMEDLRCAEARYKHGRHKNFDY